MTENNKGTLGFILVIFALIIAAINPAIGIICVVIIYILAFLDSEKTNSDNDYPYL